MKETCLLYTSNVAKAYINDENFGSLGNDLSMRKFYNLLTGANKSSYIDSFLDRAYNATELATGICCLLYTSASCTASMKATLSHVAFIEAVQDATNTFFSGEQIESPDIRVSHVIKGCLLYTSTRNRFYPWCCCLSSFTYSKS